ncbi:MAG: hypothetical protein LUC83_10015 [Clostridiales bacterium]|nr:hypothetical protein [Clostridiales bacterium]
MYKEMDSNGQYQLDCRLSSERNMEENVSAMIDFARDIRKSEVGDAKVKNRHEGYGFLADAYVTVNRSMKAVKDGMSDLLNTLPAPDDSSSVDKVESVASALADAIVATVSMAAEARRVSSDLFHEHWNPTATDNDGFSDPDEE